MENTNDFSQKLYTLWKKSLESYENGVRRASDLFDQSEVTFLNSNGMTPQDLYDYAEDFVTFREPDFATVLLIQEVRRAYFLEEQNGVLSTNKKNVDTFPDKSLETEDIKGLPRTLEKAKAKLHGELPPELMYSCPLDRAFLKENHIHPAELLRAIWFYEKNTDQKDGLIKWMVHRRKKYADLLDSIKSWFR